MILLPIFDVIKVYHMQEKKSRKSKRNKGTDDIINRRIDLSNIITSLRKKSTNYQGKNTI